MKKRKLKLKDFTFETKRYDRVDFDGYKGEINVSLDANNTNYFIKGLKYSNRLETLKELKQWLKDSIKKIEALIFNHIKK